MTQEKRYIELLAAEANRHCAMAQITTEPALKEAHLDVSLACWAGVAALRGGGERIVSMPSIGDKKTFVPAAFQAGLPGGYDKEVTGTVIWIHPRGRFYLVEVEVNGYRWHQAFGAED